MGNWKLTILIAVAIVSPIVAFLGCLPAEAAGFALLLGAVTANQVTRRAGPDYRAKIRVNGGEHLYARTMCFYNSDGYATATAGGNVFAGIVTDNDLDNSAGDDGDVDGEVTYTGVHYLSGTGFGQDDVGKKVYASDNYTATLTDTSNSYVGIIKDFVSSTLVGVDIDTGSRVYS